MHEPVLSRLEEYLRGGGDFPEVGEHLRVCESCRTEVEGMQAQALLLRGFRPVREAEPDPGFYARVMNRVENQIRPSVWTLFGDSLFARRLALASAAFLLLFGTALISSNTETDATVSIAGPETILAGDQEQTLPQITVDPRERGVVLVNLATYQEIR